MMFCFPLELIVSALLTFGWSPAGDGIWETYSSDFAGHVVIERRLRLDAEDGCFRIVHLFLDPEEA